jgi:hypothetical protein
MTEIITAKPYDFEIPQRIIEEYLGYYELETNAETVDIIEKCKKEVLDCVDYKACIAKINCCETEDGICLDFMVSKSKSLAGNLRKCETAYIFAATTGAALHRLIGRNIIVSPIHGMVTDAIGSAAIEAFCDYINQNIGDVDYLRPRFSPGYGDLSLECQKTILDFLGAGKHIGLALTDGGMLIPVKSVTAIIGQSEEKNKCRSKKGCMVCDRENCPYS